MNNKITIPLGLENPHFVLEVEYMPHFGNRALHEKVDIPTRHKEVITELFLQEWKGGKALAYGPGRPRYSVAAFDGNPLDGGSFISRIPIGVWLTIVPEKEK